MQGEELAWQGQTSLQPLTKYSLRNSKPLATKTLVLPGSVFQFFVHDGKFRKPGRSVEAGGEQCAYVAHMRCVCGSFVWQLFCGWQMRI